MLFPILQNSRTDDCGGVYAYRVLKWNVIAESYLKIELLIFIILPT